MWRSCYEMVGFGIFFISHLLSLNLAQFVLLPVAVSNTSFFEFLCVFLTKISYI